MSSTVPFARPLIALVLWSITGCECQTSGLAEVPPARLVSSPPELEFTAAWVGQQRSASIELTNLGGVSASVDVTVTPPFSASASLPLRRPA